MRRVSQLDARRGRGLRSNIASSRPTIWQSARQRDTGEDGALPCSRARSTRSSLKRRGRRTENRRCRRTGERCVGRLRMRDDRRGHVTRWRAPSRCAGHRRTMWTAWTRLGRRSRRTIGHGNARSDSPRCGCKRAPADPSHAGVPGDVWTSRSHRVLHAGRQRRVCRVRRLCPGDLVAHRTNTQAQAVNHDAFRLGRCRVRVGKERVCRRIRR